MSKNPVINALAAAAYIGAIVLGINYVSTISPEPKETLLIPMGMLSLFVLSAAVMGYLFVYQPLAMFLDGNKKGGIDFFLKTVGTFAVITALLLVGMLLVGLR